MTEERERELLRHIPTLRCADEITAFRARLREQDEELTTGLYAALLAQVERVAPKTHGKQRRF